MEIESTIKDRGITSGNGILFMNFLYNLYESKNKILKQKLVF